MNLILCLLIFCGGFTPGFAIGVDDIVFVTICQDNEVSLSKCEKIKEDLNKQSQQPVISLISYRDFRHNGDWTIFPVISLLKDRFPSLPKWFFFGTEHTGISLNNVLTFLDSINYDEPKYIGLGLMDQEPTIIHHFSSKSNFKFPLIHSGFLISRELFSRFYEQLQKDTGYKEIDFSIDASYELTSYLASLNVFLEDSDTFCVHFEKNCATFVTIADLFNENIDRKLSVDQVYFAVKTCPQFHQTRIPIVKSTWAQDVKHLTYFSDSVDKEIPTVAVNATPTHHGHCGKTREILRALRKKFKSDEVLEWAVVSDDDTLLSVQRLLLLLSAYNSSHPIAIGERYGYHLQLNNGYNYLTGGGGVVLSRAAILKFRPKVCNCVSPSSPDDMFLFGVCLRTLDIHLAHFPLIHQARPNDYSKEYLSIGPAVSFHKHWMIDPIITYHQYLKTESATYNDRDEL